MNLTLPIFMPFKDLNLFMILLYTTDIFDLRCQFIKICNFQLKMEVIQ